MPQFLPPLGPSEVQHGGVSSQNVENRPGGPPSACLQLAHAALDGRSGAPAPPLRCPGPAALTCGYAARVSRCSSASSMPNALPKAHLSTLSTPGAHLWLRLRALAARHLLPSARCYSGRAGASAGADLSARRLTKSSCASANAKDMARSSPRARGSRAGAAHGPAAWPRDAVEPRKPPSRPYLAAWPMNCSWLLWRKRRILSLLDI